MTRLPLRGRLALLTALAVAVAVAACATVSWFLVRGQLYRELDGRLRAMTSGPPAGPGMDDQRPRGWPDIRDALMSCGASPVGETGARFPTPYVIQQAVTVDGKGCVIPGRGALTVTGTDARVAAGRSPSALHDGDGVDAQGAKVRVRVLTRGYRGIRADGSPYLFAVSTALPLDEVEGPLDNLALLLVAVTAAGVLLSAGAGLMIARASLRPVDRLTGAVEHIARTEDLDTRIPEEGHDEIARLGRAFNTMTRALAGSRDRQQQLIADAGHELRTPLTSLRTNIDLLMRSQDAGRELPPDTRRRLLASVKAQMVELSSLVGDLLELARPAEGQPAREAVALHEVVERAVERARLRGPGLAVDAEVAPWFVRGDPGQLERAVVNLLDNAVKFSPPSGRVRVRLDGGQLTVRDEGPGIAPEDLPHVFERFWRSPSARSLPGSGLGLSIVARVVGEGGGRVTLEPADGGGTLARVVLPGRPVRPD
ncbi:HAMP domain-containing sensor histidine kinase [Actinomadura rupiterrae]|uniref:HAMP domain-containing sensor histidine kinase n=1 Tax=Actinomadura rupiterrae TaxID=559627 RepID=UPI0020A53973|nr:HAMP domain-containing sensor histidine kinase [Actinomadura rupiterrae]MCP2343256.1 two-component system sensor histidine kinase MprB [Actinomadura rupiterrae]